MHLKPACTARRPDRRKCVAADAVRLCRISRGAEFGKVRAERKAAPRPPQADLGDRLIKRGKMESFGQSIAHRPVNGIVGPRTVEHYFQPVPLARSVNAASILRRFSRTRR